jgi:uncharacterized protein YbjT (DUF2867 family)
MTTMERSSPILVTGATGNTGQALVAALTRRGATVRAMVRGQDDGARLPAGTAVAVADFDEPASVTAALAGAERAYLVTPSSERAETQQRRFADLAAEAGVKHLVVLSQLAAAEDSPVRFLRYHGAVERHVRELGLPYTFLRPNLYFQGLLAFAGMIAATGQFAAPIGDAAVSAVDVRDIAEVAAVVLTQPGHEYATYTLTGPEAVTHAQMAAALTAALSREISFTDATPEAFAASLHGILPPWQVEGLLEDYAHYRRGEAAAVSPAVPEITGRPAVGVAQFARDYAGAFSR